MASFHLYAIMPGKEVDKSVSPSRSQASVSGHKKAREERNYQCLSGAYENVSRTKVTRINTFLDNRSRTRSPRRIA